MVASTPLLPGLGAGLAQKAAGGSSSAPRAVKAGAGKGSPAGLRSRLQFLLDIAQATFSQPGLPTAQQMTALQRTLSQVPLEELGLSQHPYEMDSSSSSRSSSPGLSDGTHALMDTQEHGYAGDAHRRHPRPPITYLLIYEDSRVSLGIFCLPARAKIPLHNHPGMTVLSRVLYGQMHVTSYDWLDPQAGEETALPRGARRVLDATRTADDPPVVLFPRAGGNIHEFTAHTDCAVLDLMSPPYSTDDGRDCTYYTVVDGERPVAADRSLVLLDSYEPPLDFVINQGHYRGVMPRPKLAPPSPVSSSMFAHGGDESPTASADTSGGQSSQRRGASGPNLHRQHPASPVSSPTSVATMHTGGTLSSLLDSPGKGGKAGCAELLRDRRGAASTDSHGRR